VEATLTFADPRPGDVLHSLASIERTQKTLGYAPSHDVRRGMSETIGWYAARALRSPAHEGLPFANIQEAAGAS
jgi:nucleoside-diphosphate-sugar epimerase